MHRLRDSPSVFSRLVNREQDKIIIRDPERQSIASHVFLHLEMVHHFSDQRNGTIIDLP